MHCKFIGFILLFISTTLCGQNERFKKEVSPCSMLIKKGFTQEFCNYDSRYEFKGILFESKFSIVDSLMFLKRIENLSDRYDIQNEKYIDWGIIKFTKGYVQFSNNKFWKITLELMDDKGIPVSRFNEITKYLTELFGVPALIKTDNERVVVYEWKGNRMLLSVEYFNSGRDFSMISVTISSNKIFPKGTDNL